MSDTRVAVAVDVGGTFTDLVMVYDDQVRVKKVLSTPPDFSQAVLAGLEELLRESGIGGDRITSVVHATTVGSNTVATGTGARTGLLTTKGFGDLLDIGRLSLPVQNDLTWKKREPLVSRWRRRELNERIDAEGEVVKALDEGEASRAIEELVAEGVESLAVSLINAYANPVHERQLGTILRARFSALSVSLSCEMNPEILEFERTSSTVIDAYVKPSLERYLQVLEEGLLQLGYDRALFIMQSNGGVFTSALARARPSHVLESGPVAGVIGVQKWGQRTGGRNFIAFDMGGTTAKCGIVDDLTLDFRDQLEIDGDRAAGRFLFGSGYLLRAPTVELAEIGAGGGSIAWFDEGGVLQVGPQSAGAKPGPVCYDRGGSRITQTDANVLLGYFNPEYLVGGGLRLAVDKARTALIETIAEPLGLTLEAAIHGIYAVANARMTHMVRSMTTQKGRDPADYTMVASGGCGPGHAVAIAEELGVETVMVPPGPGLFSAFGLHFADIEQHRTWTYWKSLDDVDYEHINAWLAQVEAETVGLLRQQGVPHGAIIVSRFADTRYHGQGSELRIPIRAKRFDRTSARRLRSDFNRQHEKSYGYASKEPVEIFRLGIVTKSAATTISAPGVVRVNPALTARAGAPLRPQPNSARSAYFGSAHGWQESAVIQRERLDSNPTIGPLIVEEYDSTTVVPPGWAASLDSWGNILLKRAKTPPTALESPEKSPEDPPKIRNLRR